MSESLIIRPATPADRSAVTQLFRLSYPQLLPGCYKAQTLRDVLPHITTAQPALLDCGTYFLAQDGKGCVIGAGGWTDVSPARGVSKGGEGHIRHVATHPAHLRKGVARRVMEASLASARGFGVERMNCMSTLTAHRFYEAMGFVTLGEVELTLAPGVHFLAVQLAQQL
ncbi:Predicted N-acetyltransferase YhbS [Shimia gijangensis]|uniref:Predicted N-acetyltransferase YhbS n=1 Tax=Shimia gijangensis TaxID=1470563 RepID=A0A1M6FYV9_9RHOB|nr:GNAT family N-acetyltransferase [Shimia gijangensis]SHJ02850.1 Predicted N-acetyltransferase YhbS [Shimia gijangensis]